MITMGAGYELKMFKKYDIPQDEVDRNIERVVYGIQQYLKKNNKITLSLMVWPHFNWKKEGIPHNIEMYGYTTPDADVLELYTFD
jgi:hypothetical protein